MNIAKRIGLVFVTGTAFAWPAAMLVTSKIAAPWWYISLFSIAMAVGIAVIAICFGVVILIAKRGQNTGGLRPALITTAAISIICALSVASSLPN